MSKIVLLATEKPFSPSARDQVVGILKDAGHDVRVLERYAGKAALLDALRPAHAAIVRSDVIDAEALAAAPELALVVRAGAGYDTIDTTGARARNVDVMNTPGQNANAVAELAFGMMTYLCRGKFDGKTGTELRGKSLGVHAVGAVGRALLAIASGYGMRTWGFDPYVDAAAMHAAGAEPVGSVEELYERSQFVSLHVPATAETKGSIGEALLSRMPKGAMLVNTARKEVIDEAGLLAVFAERPDFRYASDIAPSDATAAVLREKYDARVYLTPAKMGAQTEEANVNAGLAAARQIVAYFAAGERRYVVNP